MADVFSIEKRSSVMSRIRSTGNKDTEVVLAGLFRAAGITGWRRHEPLMGKPDFTFRKERVVIFIDGCFWHGCRKHGTLPKSNTDYWEKKLARNQKRDRAVKRALMAKGWRVLRFWEHDLKNSEKVLRRVMESVSQVRLEQPQAMKSTRRQ